MDILKRGLATGILSLGVILSGCKTAPDYVPEDSQEFVASTKIPLEELQDSFGEKWENLPIFPGKFIVRRAWGQFPITLQNFTINVYQNPEIIYASLPEESKERVDNHGNSAMYREPRYDHVRGNKRLFQWIDFRDMDWTDALFLETYIDKVQNLVKITGGDKINPDKPHWRYRETEDVEAYLAD